MILKPRPAAGSSVPPEAKPATFLPRVADFVETGLTDNDIEAESNSAPDSDSEASELDNTDTYVGPRRPLHLRVRAMIKQYPELRAVWSYVDPTESGEKPKPRRDLIDSDAVPLPLYLLYADYMKRLPLQSLSFNDWPINHELSKIADHNTELHTIELRGCPVDKVFVKRCPLPLCFLFLLNILMLLPDWH
jgi:hypothetical protein